MTPTATPSMRPKPVTTPSPGTKAPGPKFGQNERARLEKGPPVEEQIKPLPHG
ncbi:MAG: hypothetical protein KF818_30910 [Chelatococcus sp.]|nr:hypothetical protein [Chelatococcus sp.]